MNILFFASLRERLQTGEIELQDCRAFTRARDVLEHLQARGPDWQEALQTGRIRLAINQELANLDDPVKQGDELAFFPPVTGG